MKIIFLLIILIYVVKSQIAVPGKCPNVPVYKNIDKAKIIGKWYVLKQFENPHSKTSKCYTITFDTFDDKGFSGNFNYIEDGSNKRIDTSYTGKFQEDPSEASFSCKMTVENKTVPHNVTIAHVDYEHNYIVWYTCTEDDVNSHKTVWITAKNKTLPVEANQKMVSFLDKYNMGSSHLIDLINDCDAEQE